MNMHRTVEPAKPDVKGLRRALGCFPTGVAIVTTIGRSGTPVGLTISSFNSVSMDPPLILWSLALKAASLPDFRANPHFAINVLAAEQADLPRVFSSPVDERFDAAPWVPGAGGVPVLEGTAACFECRIWNRCDGGDHEIILGEVLRHAATDRTPLVFGQGRLGALALDPAP